MDTLYGRRDKSGGVLFTSSAEEARALKAAALKRRAAAEDLERIKKAIRFLAEELPEDRRAHLIRILEGTSNERPRKHRP